MRLTPFLETLREGGRLHLPPARTVEDLRPFEAEDMAAAAAVIETLDRDARLEAPGPAPELVLPATRWAAEMLYRAGQAVVSGPSRAPEIGAVLRRPYGDRVDARVTYSVDLIFRFLPEIIRRSIQADDEELHQALLELARTWPLSSVGTAGVGSVDIDDFVDHPCLARMYCDRVLERQDLGRLVDPRVAQAARVALGAYAGLAPAVAAHLSETP